MFERGEKKVQLILFVLLLMGLVFLSKAFFLQNTEIFVDQHVAKPLSQTTDAEEQRIISNVYLAYWNPVVSFIQTYHPRGFHLEGFETGDEYYTLRISRLKAAFYVEVDEIDRMLFSEEGEMVWRVPTFSFLKRKFYSLPEIYGAETIEEARQIIERISRQSTLFKNYLSSVDAKEKICYLRNGNVLLVNSWSNLDVFDGEAFIYQMGKGQIYDLYSNGRYFPIIKRGE